MRITANLGFPAQGHNQTPYSISKSRIFSKTAIHDSLLWITEATMHHIPLSELCFCLKEKCSILHPLETQAVYCTYCPMSRVVVHLGMDNGTVSLLAEQKD